MSLMQREEHCYSLFAQQAKCSGDATCELVEMLDDESTEHEVTLQK